MYKGVIGTSEQSNLYDYIRDKYSLDSRTATKITQIITNDFNNDIKDILKGDRALRTYSKTNPLYTRGDSLTLYKEDDNYYFKWIRGIVFKYITGTNNKNAINQTEVLDKILDNEYKICDSTLEFYNKVLMLNLVLEVPVEKLQDKVEGRVAGVDLGVELTAVVAINDNDNCKEISYLESVWKMRMQIQKRRETL